VLIISCSGGSGLV